MERERGMVEQPPAKRMRLAVVPVRVGGGGGGDGLVSPRTRRLRQTLLVVLFLVRASARATVTASVSQIGGMLDRAFHKFHGMITSKLDNFQRQVESKLEAFQGQVESKLETFQEQVEGLHQEVRQLVRLHSNRHPDRHTKLEADKELAATNGSNTNIHMCFLNDWKAPIYTDEDITDENNVSIKVAVFGGDKMITTGPLSKMKIEILALQGGFYEKFQDNWTEEEFGRHIVQCRDEQGLVLGTVRLANGVVELSEIRFKEGSNRKKYIMAARVCKSQNIAGRVREAIMNKPETVKDRRNKPNEKRYPPKLNDDVYRLEEIAKNGTYHKRLMGKDILTVQGFLKAFNEDPNKLRGILDIENKPNTWSKMIVHARTCVLEDKPELKRYQSEQGDTVLFFNCVHDLVGAAFPLDFVACEVFDPVQKALVNKWKLRAYEKLEDIPSDFVLEDNIPKLISSSTDAAAAVPSIPMVGASQPMFSADHLTSYQGTGEAENSPHDQTATLLDQQPIIPRSWQQSPENLMDPFAFQCASIGEPQFSEEWTLDGFDIFPPSTMSGEGTFSCYASGSLQPSSDKRGQGPSSSAFPGSDPNNDF